MMFDDVNYHFCDVEDRFSLSCLTWGFLSWQRDFRYSGSPVVLFLVSFPHRDFPLRGIKSCMVAQCAAIWDKFQCFLCGCCKCGWLCESMYLCVLCLCVCVCNAMEHRVMCDRMPCVLCLCLANRTTHSLLHRFAASLKEVDPLPLLPGSSTTRTLPARWRTWRTVRRWRTRASRSTTGRPSAAWWTTRATARRPWPPGRTRPAWPWTWGSSPWRPLSQPTSTGWRSENPSTFLWASSLTQLQLR